MFIISAISAISIAISIAISEISVIISATAAISIIPALYTC
jgi:hypothetical protein